MISKDGAKWPPPDGPKWIQTIRGHNRDHTLQQVVVIKGFPAPRLPNQNWHHSKHRLKKAWNCPKFSSCFCSKFTCCNASFRHLHGLHVLPVWWILHLQGGRKCTSMCICTWVYVYMCYIFVYNIFQSLVSLPSQEVTKPWQFPTVVISTSSPHFPERCPLKGKVLPKRRGSNRAEIIDSSGLWNSNDCLRFWNHSNASDLGTVLSKTWQSEHRAHKFSREFDVSNRIMPLRYFLPSNPPLDC